MDRVDQEYFFGPQKIRYLTRERFDFEKMLVKRAQVTQWYGRFVERLFQMVGYFVGLNLEDQIYRRYLLRLGLRFVRS